MGTASLTAALEVLWISNQTNITCFWRPFSLLYLSALRLTHTCLATTALATPAIPAMLVTATRFPTLLPAMPVSLPLPLSLPLELPLLPSLLSEVPMLVLGVTSPTLLESSMSPRGKLRLIPTFWDMAATQATDMPASATPALVATAPTRPLLLFQPLPGPMRAPADTVQTPPAQSTVPKAQSFDPLHPGQNPLNQGSNTLFLELDNISVTNASK